MKKNKNTFVVDMNPIYHRNSKDCMCPQCEIKKEKKNVQVELKERTDSKTGGMS